MKFTENEAALIDFTHQLFQSYSFPTANSLSIFHREDQGAGIKIEFSGSATVNMPDGELAVGTFITDSLDSGGILSFEVHDKRIEALRFFANKSEEWTGEVGMILDYVG